MAFRPLSQYDTTVMKINGTVSVLDGLKLEAAGTLIRATAGSAITGFAGADGVAGDFIAIYHGGEWEGDAAAGVNFAPGEKVSAADHLTLRKTATDKYAGRVIKTDPASAGKVKFWHVSELFTDAAAI